MMKRVWRARAVRACVPCASVVSHVAQRFKLIICRALRIFRVKGLLVSEVIEEAIEFIQSARQVAPASRLAAPTVKVS